MTSNPIHTISCGLCMARMKFLLILIALAVALPLRGMAGVISGDNLEGKSSAALIGRAESYIEADTLLDRAVAALSVVANRYYDNPSDKEARMYAVTAMNQLGKIYSFRLYDFRKAYANLSTARLIAEEDGDNYQLADILSSLANIYYTCSDEDDTINAYAADALSRAVRSAIASDNKQVLNRLVNNLSIICIQSENNDYAKEFDAIKKYDEGKSDPDSRFRSGIIRAMDSYFAKDYPEAEKLLDKTLESLSQHDFVYHERYVQGTMYLMQFVYDKQQKYKEEEPLIRNRLAMARQRGLSDYELYAFYNLSSFYDHMGEQDSAKKYQHAYLELRSKLDQENGMYKITEMEMLRQIEQTNKEIRELSIQRQTERRQLTILIAVVAVVILCLITFIYLFINLRRNNRLLFEKNRQLLDREEQLKILLAHEQKGPDMSEKKCQGAESDEESANIFPSILKVMEDSRDIYRPGFGMDDLCKLLRMPERAVSRAINACNGTNFHTFLNGYRIREACRLMKTTDPQRHTVEFIATSVGFQSRTSFATLFKKTVGLTPSDYWKKANNPS